MNRFYTQAARWRALVRLVPWGQLAQLAQGARVRDLADVTAANESITWARLPAWPPLLADLLTPLLAPVLTLSVTLALSLLLAALGEGTTGR